MFRVFALENLPLFAWAIWATISRWNYKRRLDGLDDPRKWLTRRERREHAREELDEQQMERLSRYMNERTHLPHEE